MHKYFVFERVFNVWHMLKKVCQSNNILNNLWGKRRLEGYNLGISESEPLGFDCVHQFSPQGQCRAQASLQILDISNFISSGDTLIKVLLCPPFEKGGHIALHLSVGMSVCR